jgi:hypothetical protein
VKRIVLCNLDGTLAACSHRIRRCSQLLAKVRPPEASTGKQLQAQWHAAPLSASRITLSDAIDMRQLTAVEGRILVHGQDEQSGQSYSILDAC